MKRAIAYGLVALLLVLIAGTIVAVGWVLGTTDGARWTLQSLSRFTPLRISAVRIEGRLLDSLRLEGVKFSSGRKRAAIGQLVLKWQPVWLMTGRLMIDELVMAAVAVQDDSPPGKKPLDLSWPRLPGVADHVAVEINSLRLTNLHYRHLEAKPVQVKDLRAVIYWRDGTLSLPVLSMVADWGKVKGSMAAGFHRPSLGMDLVVTPVKPVAHMDSLSVSGRLIPARAPEQLAGPVLLAGSSKGGPRLKAKAELGMTRTAFNLRRLKITRPGRRGAITGGGTLSLAAAEPEVALSLAVADLDLSRELKMPTDLSGSVTLAGTSKGYHGRFSIGNRGKGWRDASLAATFRGGAAGLSLAPLAGVMLGGTMAGNLELGWLGGITVKGRLQGKNLDPARLAKGWTGNVNFNAAGEVALPKQGSIQGKVAVVLLESRLHGQPLTGGAKGDFAGKNLQIANLDLHGRGFDLHGSGNFSRRFELAAVVTDLSRLVPETAGELRLAGWGAWKDGRAAGSLSGSGRKLKGRGIGIGSISFEGRVPQGMDRPVHLAAVLQKAAYRQFQADSIRVKMDGKISDHLLSMEMTAPEASINLALAGSYKLGAWQATINRFSGRDRIGPWRLHAPARLEASSAKLSLAKMALAGIGRERLEAEAELRPGPVSGDLAVRWEEINLNRLTPWLQGVQVSGISNGGIAGSVLSGDRLSFTIKADGQAKVTREGRTVTIERANLNGAGSEKGIHLALDVKAAEGVHLEAKLATATPARLALPEQGTMALQWQVADLAVLQPWMKGNIKVAGGLAGAANGTFLPGNRVEMAGDVTLTGGNLHWQKPEGEGTMALKDVSVKWSWQGDTLRGTVGLTLAEFGQARGSFLLPVPAAFPVSPDPHGAVSATLSGQLREQGVLSAFMPGLVQESHGLVDINLKVGGVWQEPRLQGKLQLSRAGAYLPAAGITLRDVALSANLDKDQAGVSFSALSGSGQLKGEGVALLQGWQVASYRGTINGDRFQLIHLPELEASGSPQLSFDGTMKKLAVRGEVRLPVLLIHGQPPRASIQPSKDVILEGAPAEKKAPPLALDVQVRVTLGDRVLVKAEGIDAQMGGSMDLTLASLDNISSKGEIKVVKGRYKAYGLDLAIARGRVFYAGGPVNEPLLDILALRTIGEVRAGVTVSGTPRTPVIKLYSVPAMPDMDILAYMVLGHPLGASSEQAGLMAQAAGLLLSTGQSVVLQDQIKNRLGLSTIEIESGKQGAAEKMGYREIPVTPSGVAPAKQPDAGVSQSILTLGKYLTPQLYISYGRSLFTGANLFRLRYDISRRLQLETETGSESGADLYYKMNFN